MRKFATDRVMMTWIVGPQIRAARGLLGWNLPRLAEESGVSGNTIRRAERAIGVPKIRADNLIEVQRALEKAGIAFLDGGVMMQAEDQE